MSSLQALRKPHSEEEHQQNLRDLVEIEAPRHTLTKPFKNPSLRNHAWSNGRQLTQKPGVSSQADPPDQSDQAVASVSERNNVNGDAKIKDRTSKAVIGPDLNESVEERRLQNTSTEASRSSINASRSTNTEYSIAPSLVLQKPLAGAGPSSVEPKSADRQVPHQGYELTNTKGRFFELPAMSLSEDDIYQCSQIKDRLRHAIENQFHLKKGVDRFYSLRYMMVKPKGLAPKATVVLTCCNKANKKELEKIAKSLAKFDKQQDGPMSRYPFIVHVDEPALQSADGDHILSSRTVFAFISDNAATLSGVTAEFDYQFGEGNSGGAPRKFTIGGIILVDGMPYALTVAHPFQPQHVESLAEDGNGGRDDMVHLEDDITNDDSSDEDGSDHQSLLAMYNSDEGRDQQSSPTTTTTGIQASEALDLQKHSTEPCKTADRSKRVKLGTVDIWSKPRSSVDCSQTRSPTDPDFALIRIMQTEQWKPNLITLPGQRFPIEVIAFTKSIDEYTSADVWVNAGVSGIQKGWLTQGTVFLNYGYTCYEAREVLLQKPLAPGDSGSWVITTDQFQLCGHIVAAKASSPRAYMVPFGDISNGVASSMKADDIGLSSVSVAMKSMTDQKGPLIDDTSKPIELFQGDSLFVSNVSSVTIGEPEALIEYASKPAKNTENLTRTQKLPPARCTGDSQNLFAYKLSESQTYPESLLRQPWPHQHARRRKHSKFLENKPRLFSDGPHTIHFIENETLCGEWTQYGVQALDEMKARLDIAQEDPLVRHALITKVKPSDPLDCPADMFKYLLTFQQVDDSFLDMVEASGRSDDMPSISLATFSSEQVQLETSETFCLPRRGLSGQEMHMCYLLQSIEFSDFGSKWVIRPAVVYHSFDLGTGRSFWLTIQANDLIHRRIHDGRDWMVDWARLPPKDQQIPTYLRVALATHLVYLAWCDENWGRFIDKIDKRVEDVSVQSRFRRDFYGQQTLRHVDKPDNIGTWDRLKKRFTSMWQPAGARKTSRFRSEKADIRDEGPDDLWSVMHSPQARGLPSLDGELHGTKQHIGRALLAIRKNLAAIGQISDFYTKMGSGRTFPQPLKKECGDIIEDFVSQTQSIIKGLETRCTELECLTNEIDQELRQYDRDLRRAFLQRAQRARSDEQIRTRVKIEDMV